MQNLLPAASKVIILQHHQGSQIGIYIDPNFLTSKTINQKNAGLEKSKWKKKVFNIKRSIF